MNRLRCLLRVVMMLVVMVQGVYAFPVCKNKDGSLNTTFGTAGTTVTQIDSENHYADGVTVLPCGKIAVTATGDDFMLIRYLPYGVKDTNSGFGTDGIVTTDFATVLDPEQSPSFDAAAAIALQKNCNNCVSECATNCDIDCNKNCKLVAVGFTDALLGGGTGQTSFAVARYDCNGKLDTSFGYNGLGITIIPIGDFYSAATAVAIQDDGKIVVVGFTYTAEGDTQPVFVIVRLNCDGSLDETFGCQGTGIVTVKLGGDGYDSLARTVAIQRDGKIVVGGGVRNAVMSNALHFGLVRLTSRGRLDKTFGHKGEVITDLGGVTSGIEEVSDDKLTSVVLVEDCEKCFDERSLKIVAVGYSTVDDAPLYEVNKFVLVGYNGNGTLDTCFGPNGTGLVTTSFSPTADQLYNNEANAAVLARDCNGVCKIVVVGSARLVVRVAPVDNFAVARYTVNGWLDTSFGFGGKVITIFPSPVLTSAAYAVALQENGNIVAAGIASTPADELALNNVGLANYTVCQPCCLK